MLRHLLPRCEASTRLLLSSFGASGALHALAAVVIVSVFGVLSPNLLPPPHGRNAIELTARAAIVIDPVTAPQPEPVAHDFPAAGGSVFRAAPSARQRAVDRRTITITAAAESNLPPGSIERAKPPADQPVIAVARRSVHKKSPSRTPPSATASPFSKASAGQLDEIPATIHNPRPEYPVAALAAGIEGRVVVRADLDRRGRVERTHLHRSSGNAVLDEAACDAVGQWRFEPATRLGIPVATAIAVPINFLIERE